MPSRKDQKTEARYGVVESPGWTSAVDMFKTPKSPTPAKRTTRRSSVYQRKPAKTDITKAKSLLSPPGVKTRARRSSIYQKGGKLFSPSSLPLRTRRTSMYVGKNLQSINEFSKVWATPVKSSTQIAPVVEPVKKSVEKKIRKTPAKQVAVSPPKSQKRSARKAKMSEGDKSKETNDVKTPKLTKKPPTMKKSEKGSSKKISKGELNQSDVAKKTPAASRKTPAPKKLSKTLRGEPEVNQIVDLKLVETPIGTTKSPLVKKSAKKSAKKAKVTELDGSEDTKKTETPKKATKKTPAVKKSPARTNLKSKTPLRVVSVKENSSPIKEMKMSTPLKSFEEMTGKSFYSTPKQTPIQKALDKQVKPSTGTAKSRGKRVSMPSISTPATQEKSTRKQYRKTPKPTKRPTDNVLDASLSPSSPKKMKESVSKVVDKPTVSTDGKGKTTTSKAKLSPLEMSSILKSAAEIEKMESQMARETTPIVSRKGKKIYSRKLTELDMNESNNADQDISGDSPNTTLDLNETVYTDSRSSRCTIL